MRILKKEYNHSIIAAEDSVVGHAPVSFEGGKFLAAWGDVKAVASNDVNIAVAVMLMGRAVVAINVHPGLESQTIDEIWDRTVPKDQLHSGTAGNDQIDTTVDQTSDEAAVFNEPGIPNPTILAENNGLWVKRVWDHEHVFTFADTSDGFKDASPDTYIPNTSFSIVAQQRVQMDEVPGWAMIALATPLLTQTTTAHIAVIAGREILMLRHLTRLIDEAWMHFAGLNETGAESPFLNIADLIVELTEPLVHEESAGAWGAASFNCWSRTNILTEVPRSNVVPNTLTAY